MNLRAVKASYGSRPWFAVPAESHDSSPAVAVWLDSGARTVETADGPVTTDGAIRFFSRKRDLVEAVERTAGVELA